jgi:ATP/maltotriose-dependent transcriptional regulator MalT
LCRGDLATAERSFRDALRTAEQHAHGLIVVLARTYLAVLLRFRGDVDGVPAAVDAADAVARESKMMTYVAVAQANRAWVHYRRGEVGQVEPLAREALDSWSSTAAQYPFRWLAAWPLAAVLSARGALPEAVAVLEGVLRPDQQVPPSGMDTEVRAARVALDGGETAAARAHVERALAIARAAGEL